MKICPKCGKRYEENQNFCKTCGMRLVEENQRPSGNPPVKKKSHIGLYIMIVIFAVCIGAGAFAVVKISDNKKQEEAEQSQVSKNDKSTDKADSKDAEEKDSRETKKDAEEDVEPVEGTMTAEEKAKAEEEKQKEEELQKEKEEKEQEATETAVTPHPVLDLSPERLADYNYLLNNFFIVDPNTATNPEQLNAANFLAEDLTMKQDNSKPQILIYHSHSQEDFTDTVPGDVSTTVVGVGDYLAQILQDQYGYSVIHVTDAFDIVNGELDRNQAYDFARAKVEQVLQENPSIEVVIDLHRDGVPEDRHLVTEINGKPTAQIMCYNGLSYTVNNGPVDYLPNPYVQDNLAFSFQLEYQAEQYYPDLYRGIYLAGLRYNLHLRPKAILLEAGAQTNSVVEVKNAMEPFADILNRVLTGEG